LSPYVINDLRPEFPMAAPWAHECWTAEAAQRGTGLRAIIFAPVRGAKFVSPWFYRGKMSDTVRPTFEFGYCRRMLFRQPYGPIRNAG
jgi:hypothetical protein